MATNYAADLIHYFDDFLLVGPPGQLTCSESTETMLRVCERLGIPVALDKLEVDINLALRAALASCISFLLSEYVLPVALTEVRTSERSPRSPASTNQGIECSMPAAHLKPKRQSITNEMLGQMLSELDRDHKPSHDCLMLNAAITLRFFGLLRVSEFTVPNQHGFNPDQHLTAKDITMRKDSMVVVIKKSKTDQRGESCQINIGHTHTKCCPHLAMQRYLGQVTRSAKKPLCLFESRTALTARALRLVLHHLIWRCGYSTKLYHTHSLRIGAATAVSRSGLYYNLGGTFRASTPIAHLTMASVMDGCSPLYIASLNGHLDVVKTLLEAGANINQANKAALVERLYLHLQDPSSSEPEPEHEDVPNATPESEDSCEEGATTESTPYIFNQFASALHWIMATNYAADLIHYLDDFLLAGPPGQPTCSELMETMLRVCERLGIPVALDKLEGPATTITFLGITINTTLQQLQLPPDKLQEMIQRKTTVSTEREYRN
ncbi:hypothetical protein EMCRGX_G005005 [Ephydatia muelleri]